MSDNEKYQTSGKDQKFVKYNNHNYKLEHIKEMKRAMCEGNAPALISAASSTAPTASQASASMLLGESCKHGEATKQMKQQQLPPQSQREMTMDAHASTSTYAPSAIPSAKQAPDAFAYQQMMFPQQLFDLTFKKSEMKNYDMLNESIISSFFHDLMLYHMQNELPQKMAEAGISEHFATPYPEGSDLKTLPPNFYASGPTKCWYCKRGMKCSFLFTTRLTFCESCLK